MTASTTVGDIDRVVVVGAGMAGGNAVVTLREQGYRGRLVLIGDEPELPFGRPPLSKTYLRGEEDLSAWRVRPASWYAQHDVELRIPARVQRVDTGAQHVLLDSGERVDYDRLLLCTGGRARRPRIPGASLRGVHVLRTVADCEAIRAAARPGTRAVVVGMGFIGSEVAASLRQLGVEVSAIMSGGAPLEAVLGPEAGAALATIHREHGVELLPGDRAVTFEGNGSLQRVITEGGAVLPCELAVVGVGMEPDVDALAGTGLASDGGVAVDARCQAGARGVLAAGDVAAHDHPLFGRVRVEHYNSAEKMGAAAARSALGDPAPYAYVHTFWSDQYEDKLEYAGHAPRWDEFVVRGDLDARSFIGFYLERGVLRAALGFNRGGDPELEPDSELRACTELIAARAAPDARLLADESAPLLEISRSR